MTDEMLSQIISDELNQHINLNRPEIIRGLHSVLANGSVINSELQNLLIAAIQISAQVSVQFTIRSLEKAGVVSLPPEGTPILRDLNEK